VATATSTGGEHTAVAGVGRVVGRRDVVASRPFEVLGDDAPKALFMLEVQRLHEVIPPPDDILQRFTAALYV
jgi:hypothetical protein